MKRWNIQSHRWARLLPLALLSATCVLGSTLQPIPISFGGTYISTNYTGVGGEGTFVVDNEVQFFWFDIVEPNTAFFVSSFSWGDLGGFTPEMTLYLGDGTLVAGGTTSSGTHSGNCATLTVVSDLCLDAFINTVLQPGNYLLALTQDGNDPQGDLSAGFRFSMTDGVSADACTSPNFTGSSEGCLGYGGDGAFYAWYDTHPQLNGIWAISVAPAVAPEPTPGLLIFSALAILGGIRTIRSRHTISKQTRIDASRIATRRAE